MKRAMLVFCLIVLTTANALSKQSDFPKGTGPYPVKNVSGMTPEFIAHPDEKLLSNSGHGFYNSEKKKRIDEFIQSFMDSYQIPGLAIAIVEDNKMVTARAFGVKNLDTKEPITAESIFHMASVSKPFSATAIMQLVKKGKIKLDDPLIEYLPYFKLNDSRYKEITIKQMLMHTSGIPDVHDYEWDKPQFDDGAADLGFRSYIVMLPERSLAVIAASNFEGTPINDLTFGVIDIMLGFEPHQPKIPILMTLGKTIADSDVQKTIAKYRELKSVQPNSYDFSETQLNILGYQLIKNERLDDAI